MSSSDFATVIHHWRNSLQNNSACKRLGLGIFRFIQWRHNGRDGVSNHQPCDCLLNRLFRRRSKKASKLRVTGLCAGNSPVTVKYNSVRVEWYCLLVNIMYSKPLIYKTRTTTFLIHQDRDKMVAISQTTFSKTFSWMKIFEFRLVFHWSLFLRAKLTISQHYSR